MGIEARVKAARKPFINSIKLHRMRYTLRTLEPECKEGHYVTEIRNYHGVLTYPNSLGGRPYDSPCHIESDNINEAKSLQIILAGILRNKAIKSEVGLVSTFEDFKGLLQKCYTLTPQSA
ncbi:MAG: hypothetical protein V1702_02870 [Candidatus Woesearchaeota archaeon]